MNVLPLKPNILLLSLLMLSSPAWVGSALADELHSTSASEALSPVSEPVSLSPHTEDGDVAADQKKWKRAANKQGYAMDYSGLSNHKATRMSAEQKRALRRQINDASHDIYVSGN